MRTFLTLWVGQTASVLGSALTGFALNVWVYTQTGSVTQFALVAFFSMLPGLLLSPVIGALVDRWDRRRTLILSDTGAGLVTVAIALLVYFQRLEVWHLYVLLSISSLFNAFQFPAFSASVTLLVKKEQLGRAAGMSQLGPAVSMVLAPLLAPLLLDQISLVGVILLDIVSFTLAVTTLLIVRIPAPPKSQTGAQDGNSLLRDAAVGWRYIQRRQGLLSLLILMAVANLVMGFVQVLLPPIVLDTWTVKALGHVLAAGSLGMVLGGLLMSVWGGPSHRVRWILTLVFLQGLALTVGAPAPSVLGLGVVVFFVMMFIPGIASASQAIWQIQVEPDVQGRVFAMRRMMAMLTRPLAYLLAGPLSDHVFEPLLLPDGLLANSVGPLIGVGSGRGTALFASGLGLLLMLTVVRARAYGPLRALENDPPEAPERLPKQD